MGNVLPITQAEAGGTAAAAAPAADEKIDDIRQDAENIGYLAEKEGNQS